MFNAALFTIAKTWKHLKCPSVDKWIKKMWYIYIIEYYSAINKNEVQPFETTQVNLEGIMLIEIKSEGERQILHDSTYLEEARVVKIRNRK